MKHALKMHVPMRIVSYLYTVIVPCTVLYDVPIKCSP